MRKSPSLTALRAFEALIRHGSMRRAADELCVTPAAICHRLHDLENDAGGPLTERQNGIFQPTARGKRVLLELGDAFSRIASAFEVLGGTSIGPVVRVTAPSSFALIWLLPRLPLFEEQRPNLLVSLKASEYPEKDASRDWDVIIRCSAATPPGRGWRALFTDTRQVVAKPGHPSLAVRRMEDLLTQKLIYIEWEDQDAGPRYPWSLWAQARGIDPARLPNGEHVNQSHMAISRAEQGRGVALCGGCIAAEAIAAGRLSSLAAAEMAGITYWIWSRSDRSPAADNARAFANWITLETSKIVVPISDTIASDQRAPVT